MKKRLIGLLAMCLVLVSVLSGCGFSVGNPGKESVDYKDVFVDRYEEAKADGAYKGTMIEYKYSLPGYGEMSIYVDTTEGDKFEMIEGSSAFQVKDEAGELKVTGVVMDKDQFAKFTAYADDDYVVNGRSFWGLINEYGSIDIYSYMADCGVDGGLCLEATDEEYFRLVAFRGTPIEGAMEQEAYKGKLEETPVEVTPEVTDEVPEEVVDVVDVQDLFDEDTMGFANGYVFDLSEAEIEERQGFNFKIKGSESIIETAVSNEYSASEAAQIMSDNLKASSDKTPVMDFHSEGVYITGMLNNELLLCFLADGPDTTYIMSMRTVDVDNSIKIFNGVISDFLAGGATDSSVRTEYGQPVDGGEVKAEPKEGSYYIAPAGYECTYTCEYFDNYGNGEYEYQFNFLSDNDLVDFAKGTNDTYLDQKLVKIGEVDSAYGKVVIGERTNGTGYYVYHAVSADGTVNIELNSEYSEQIDKSTCEKLIKNVLK